MKELTKFEPFTTFLTYGEKVLFWDEHFKRLGKSASWKWSGSQIDEVELKNFIRCSKNYFGLGEEKFISRVSLNQDDFGQINFNFESRPFIESKESLKLNVCRKNLRPAGLPEYFKVGMKDLGCEGLIVDSNEVILETDYANVFIIFSNEVVIPETKSGLLDGIGRKIVKSICSKLNIAFSEREIKLSELENATEIFCANSVRGVLEVDSIMEVENDLSSKLITAKIKNEFNRIIDQEWTSLS